MCKITDRCGRAFHKIQKHYVHRIFITEDNNKNPIACISMTDYFKYCLQGVKLPKEDHVKAKSLRERKHEDFMPEMYRHLRKNKKKEFGEEQPMNAKKMRRSGTGLIMEDSAVTEDDRMKNLFSTGSSSKELFQEAEELQEEELLAKEEELLAKEEQALLQHMSNAI